MTTTGSSPAGAGTRPIRAEDDLWFVLDRPENLLTITAVLWTAAPVDPDRFRALVAGGGRPRRRGGGGRRGGPGGLSGWTG